MIIDEKTDTELLELWQQLTSNINQGRTAVGATQELRAIAELHRELSNRGYEPRAGSWVKKEPLDDNGDNADNEDKRENSEN